MDIEQKVSDFRASLEGALGNITEDMVKRRYDSTIDYNEEHEWWLDGYVMGKRDAYWEILSYVDFLFSPKPEEDD